MIENIKLVPIGFNDLYVNLHLHTLKHLFSNCLFPLPSRNYKCTDFDWCITYINQ